MFLNESGLTLSIFKIIFILNHVNEFIFLLKRASCAFWILAKIKKGELVGPIDWLISQKLITKIKINWMQNDNIIWCDTWASKRHILIYY